MPITALPLLALSLLLLISPSLAEEDATIVVEEEQELSVLRDHSDTIWRVASMVQDREVQALAKAQGLDVVNVTWEDTGRYENSVWGPNISDVTIEVHERVLQRFGAQTKIDPQRQNLVAMPVLRYPNFSDLSADLPIESIRLLVGNERGEALRPVGLAEVLGNLRQYLRNADDWLGEGQSLLAQRDSHVLVSAQATFLPIPAQGTATFNPIVFNYQSRPFDPAVLVILATAEGSSITVIDPARDPDAHGQRIFHHADGQRASMLGRRLSERLAADSEAASKESPDGDPSHQAGPAAGLNMLMLIQVPLRQWSVEEIEAVAALEIWEGFGFSLYAADAKGLEQPDVEAAALEVGALEGPFKEIGGLEIERDARFPIRVTVQFYQATSNGLLNAEIVEELAAQIRRVYEDADFVGSLVTDARADRPTRSYGPLQGDPPDWYQGFWQRWEEEQGQARFESERRLQQVLGEDWQPAQSEAAFRLMLRGLFAEDQIVAQRRLRYIERHGSFDLWEEYPEWLDFWEKTAGRHAVSSEEDEATGEEQGQF